MMKRYLKYRAALDHLLDEIEWGRSRADFSEELHCSVNGGAAQALREMVSAAVIRRNGAYFTSEDLGRKVVRPLARTVELRGLPVCDPTCGTGDLLLRWAEHLPIFRALDDTLESWQKIVHGMDLHGEFLAVARRRLALLAIKRGARYQGRAKFPIDRYFPGLLVGNVLRSTDQLPSGSTLLMNPPFIHGPAPKNCTWANGKVSHAALTFMQCLEGMKHGQRIAAILPDVLRSGQRYAHWREKVAQHAKHARAEIVGKFDEFADIDVFILRVTVGTKTEKDIDWHASIEPGKATIGSLCAVHVGSVVPHRDEQRGRSRPYVTVQDLPAWTEKSTDFPVRRHWTKGVSRPFVAVRRTSSPSDSERAIGTLVRGKGPVLAENHLITVRPLDGRLATCQQVLKTLKCATTRRWLDRRIRCRHLTVGSVRDIPLIA